MAETQWHWTEGGKQAGPGPLAELARRVADGRVGPDEQVWADGMADWAAVGDVPALSPRRPPTVPRTVPADDAAADPLGYFSTPPALPPRAADALRGHAPPTGDAADWPVDDARVGQLRDAARARRPIAAAAELFRALAVVAATTTVVLTGAAVTAAAGGSGRHDEAMGLALFAVVFGGGGLLSHVAARSARRSRRAGPAALLAVFLLFAAVEGVAVIVGLVHGSPGVVVGNLTGLAVAAAASAVAGRAVMAAPRYRRHPAWCQELIARVERPA